MALFYIMELFLQFYIPGNEVEAFEFPIDLSLVAERHSCCRPSIVPTLFDISLLITKSCGFFSLWIVLSLLFGELLISSAGIDLDTAV